MKLKHIIANGRCYIPHGTRDQIEGCREGVYHPVCEIKKLLFGRWQVDFHDEDYKYYNEKGQRYYPLDKSNVNTRIILYPSGIEQIKWDFN